MSGLIPEGWILSTVGEFAYNANGARKPISLSKRIELQGDFPYIGATGQIDSLNDFTHEGEHILVGEDGANLVTKSKNLAFIFDGKFWVNNHAHALKCLAEVPAKFLSNYINSLDLKPYVTGSAQPKLTKGNLEKIQVPLPPLAEQKVIADKLDELLAQVESTKARLDAIPAILKSFRQSVLAAAVSGELTEEWRGDKNLLLELSEDKLANVIDEMRNGLSAKPNEKGLGYPILRISSVRSLFVDQVDIRFLELEPKTLEMYSLKLNDILFTRYNGSLDYVGVCGQIKSLDHDHLVYPDKLIRVRVNNNKILANYLELYSASTEVRDFIKSLVKSTSGQKGISGKDLKDMLIKYPPILEQTEIVRRVEELFAFADKVEAQVNAAQARVNNLTQSILAKAFRGELTADWRAANPELISGDNSAEALLKRIKAERAKLKPVKKTTAKKAKA